VCKSYLTFVASERKLAKLYIGSLIRTVGRSLIRLFLPIYLLDLGFTLPQIIVYYYMVKSIVWALATIPSEWISRRWSPEHSIVVGTFFSIANYLFLSSIKSSEISYLCTYIYFMVFFVMAPTFAAEKRILHQKNLKYLCFFSLPNHRLPEFFSPLNPAHNY
jgi:hypothetical protein